MGGSVTIQFIYDAYHNNLAQTVTTEAITILGAMGATMQGAVMIYVLIIGKQMMFNAMSADIAVTKLVRAIIVVSLMSAANYQTFIATPITTTIPNFIANTVTNQQGMTAAQNWDALMNAVYHLGEQLHSQALGLAYIGERVTIWIFVLLAWIIILASFFIWAAANATVDLLVPLGAVLLPFYLFDATRSYVERWVGKIVSLFLVMTLTLMLAQIVVFQDASFLSRFSTNIAAAPPPAAFNFLPDTDNIGIGPTTAGSVAGATINVDSGIAMLGNAVVVFLFGLFLLAITTRIALHIGGSSGFSAAPAFNAMKRVTTTAVRSAIRG